MIIHTVIVQNKLLYRKQEHNNTSEDGNDILYNMLLLYCPPLVMKIVHQLN